MKRIILLIALCLLPLTASAGLSAIVQNTSGATTGEDSISVSFVVTDSIGNISGLDSIFVAIWNSLGDSTYAAAYITTAAEIDSIDLGGARTVWKWTEAIADIDAGGRIGTYTGIIIAIDTLDGTGAEYLDQAGWFSFQIVNAQFSSLLDSAGVAALASEQALDSLADALDSLESISTALAAVRDSLQFLITSSGDTAVGGDTRDIAITAIRDSLQFLITSVGDTAIGGDERDIAIAAMRDSLQFLTTATSVTVSDKTGFSLSAAGIDAVWDEDSTGHWTSPNMAFISGQTSAGSMTEQTIAREVWTIAGPDDSTYAVGTMGKDAELWDATGASAGVDSTVLSNMLRRVIFGIAVGSGSDSTTLAQRKILAEQISNAAEAGIYAEFISGSNEDAFKSVGDTAIGGDERDIVIATLALEASLFDPTSDSVLMANLGEVAIEVADSTLDTPLTGATHNVSTSLARRVRAIAEPTSSGTAQVSGTPTSPETYIILAAAESEADDFYNGNMVHIVSGTGIGQIRSAGDYTGATDSLTLHPGDDWTTNPDATSVYDIVPWAAQEVTHIHDAALAAITDDILDEDTANHNTADSYGVLFKDTTVYQANLGALATLANQVFIIDSINAILDTLQNSAQTDTLNAIIDSLQSQDDWVAKEASLFDGDLSALATLANQTLIIDTVNGIIDSVNLFSAVINGIDVNVDSLLFFDGYCNDCRSIAGPGATTDTLHVYKGASRLLRFLYWHVGGATGDKPDSTTILDN